MAGVNPSQSHPAPCLLSEKQAKSIKAVGLDRSGAYFKVIREDLPKAEVVFDKFHIAQNFNEVIDEVRRTETAKAVEEKKGESHCTRLNLKSMRTTY